MGYGCFEVEKTEGSNLISSVYSISASSPKKSTVHASTGSTGVIANTSEPIARMHPNVVRLRIS